MNRSLEEVEFTIFDTETTGLEPQSGDKIVEIAGIRLKGQKIISSFQSLVNPHREISEGAFQVNRITQDMLKGAPEADAVLPEFLEFAKGSCLCSYNAVFDMEFLNNESRLIGKGTLEDLEVIDVLKMARRLLPGLERYALMRVAQTLAIRTIQQHRAFSDVELTLKVFNKLLDIFKGKGVYDFANFVSLFGINRKLVDNVNNQKIARIQQAMDLGVGLKIKYLSSHNAEVTERQVMPKEIKQDRDSAYLVGFCSLRKEERTFRIDGILHLEIV